MRDFSIDGLLLFRSPSCRAYNMTELQVADSILEELGIPSVILDIDLADDRKYSDAQATARLEAFKEILEARKK